MMVNLRNQRTGDEWIVDGVRYQVLGDPIHYGDGWFIPCREVDTGEECDLSIMLLERVPERRLLG